MRYYPQKSGKIVHFTKIRQVTRLKWPETSTLALINIWNTPKGDIDQLSFEIIPNASWHLQTFHSWFKQIL